MKKITFLILFSFYSLNLGLAQDKTYIYKNYENSIIRKPYPGYVIQGQYIYRLYPNSIIRKPYPEFTIKSNYIYRNYENSIIRKPYPIGTLDGELSE